MPLLSSTKNAVPVNKIIPLSTVDGPGARTSIFLQGCNIACLYCHNPETQRMCIHCKECVKHCPVGALSYQNKKVVWNKTLCVNCDTCINICPNFASPKISMMTAEDVMQEVRKNISFIRGISVSGGECTLYPEFLSALFMLAKKEGLTCLIDHNGMTNLEKQTELMQLTDGVMLDLKAWDKATFRRLTGAHDNSTIKKNLSFLAKANKLEEVRLVYVPNYVDAKQALSGSAQLLGEYTASIRLKLIAFRSNGVRGALEVAPTPTKEEMQSLYDFAHSLGFETIVLV